MTSIKEFLVTLIRSHYRRYNIIMYEAITGRDLHNKTGTIYYFKFSNTKSSFDGNNNNVQL